MKTIFHFLMLPLLYAAALLDEYHARALCFYDSPPTDLKALHEATEKAFKLMTENISKAQETAMMALETIRAEGTITAEQNAKLKELGEIGAKTSESITDLKSQILEVQQKLVKNPRGGNEQAKSIGQLVTESDQYKVAGKNLAKPNMDPVVVGSFHKTNIVNATGLNQPLVPGDRLPGIVMPVNRRLTVRDLLAQNRTSSNMIEFASETLFTNSAGAQGGPTSPIGNGEGELKPESTLTFQLNNTPVVTIAHFIPASRQILADAPMLQGYVDGRLRYGLALKEETDLLNGDGGAGALNGLVNQATAFTGGVTNQTALDTILKAFLQISLQNLEATGIVLNPTDWTAIQLLKDTTGRYLFADPHSAVGSTVWGRSVVSTASQTLGQFLAGAFMMAAEIFDREDATVRVAEQHADFFVRNMVAILAEERLALAMYRTAAIVKGSVSNAG